MIELRPLHGLGRTSLGWLEGRHHFSFSGYLDPTRMGLGCLRVCNDDAIQPGTGFAPHAHRDLDIVTYVYEGAITQRNSDGRACRIPAGHVHALSAGAGIRHDEINAEDTETRAFQLWLLPDGSGGEPEWGMVAVPKVDESGFVTLVSGLPGDPDALRIRANARVAAASLKPGGVAEYRLGRGRCAYLLVVSGRVDVNGVAASVRDGVAIQDISVIRVAACADSRILLVDAA